MSPHAFWFAGGPTTRRNRFTWAISFWMREVTLRAEERKALNSYSEMIRGEGLKTKRKILRFE